MATGEVNLMLSVCVKTSRRIFGGAEIQRSRIPDQVTHSPEHIHLKQLSIRFNSVLDVKNADV